MSGYTLRSRVIPPLKRNEPVAVAPIITEPPMEPAEASQKVFLQLEVSHRKPRRKHIPKNVLARARKSILKLITKKLIIFRVSKLLVKAKAVKVIASAFKKYRLRKSLKCLKNMILFYKERIMKIQNCYTKYILKKAGRALISDRISEISQLNELKNREIKKVLNESTYLKSDPAFLDLYKSTTNHSCMLCMEELPRHLMVESYHCGTCNPSYCRLCWRKFNYKLVKNGIYCSSRKIFDCLYCSKPITMREPLRKSLSYPDLDSQIITLYFKILYSIGFEESYSCNDMFEKFTSETPFSLTYTLLKTRNGKTYMFLPTNLLPDYLSPTTQLSKKTIPTETTIETINPRNAYQSLTLMNIMTFEKVRFEPNLFIEKHIEFNNSYTFSKNFYILNKKGMLDVIYKTLFITCRKCHKDDIIGWKKTGCGEEETVTTKDYYCTKCTDPNVRVCPGCNVYCTRIDGCNEMTCNCGILWCYCCNTKLSVTNRLSHYIKNSFGPCKGREHALSS